MRFLWPIRRRTDAATPPGLWSGTPAVRADQPALRCISSLQRRCRASQLTLDELLTQAAGGEQGIWAASGMVYCSEACRDQRIHDLRCSHTGRTEISDLRSALYVTVAAAFIGWGCAAALDDFLAHANASDHGLYYNIAAQLIARCACMQSVCLHEAG